MGKLTDLDKAPYGGEDEIFPNMMSAMSILSDAQAMLEWLKNEGRLSEWVRKRANDTINHAKAHLSEAMQQYHEKEKLPGVLLVSSGDFEHE